ncbi:MAG: hypothetical protein ACC628_08080 [Pirellulaceae bacterium]
MKTIVFHVLQFAGIALLAATTGCAAAYHDYPDGCVPYAYCEPPPLPYDTYEACLTPVAASYFGSGYGPNLSESEAPLESRSLEAAEE